MSYPNISKLVGDAWTEFMRTHPDPFHDDCGLFKKLFGDKMPTYRERLDKIQVNYYGNPIPRITIVRNNLSRLKQGKPYGDPSRLR